MPSPLDRILDSGDPEIYDIHTRAPGPQGSLPFTPDLLRTRPSGDLFGWSQDAGMGWNPGELGRREILLLSTHGGIRAADGTPIALGYHTGHWEVGLLMQSAASELKALGAVPFAGYCTDPCDGRTQGTTGMFDSLPYRNDAAIVFRRLIRSLPTRRGVLGFATCDKGLPAMMMALAGSGTLPCVLVPGGVMLAPEQGEDTAFVQTIGARFAHGAVTLERGMPRPAAAPAHRRAEDASSSAPPRRRRSSAKLSACRSPIRRSRPPARQSGSTWPAVPAARCWRSKSAASPCGIS